MKAGAFGSGFAIALMCIAASAQASTTIGQAPPPGTLQGGCDSDGVRLSAMQFSNTTGNSYGVPAGGGVITSWRSSMIGGGTLQLRVFSADSSTSAATAVAQSDPYPLNLQPVAPQPVRIPVSGGERIGFALATEGAVGCLASDNALTDTIVGTIAGPVGQPEPPVAQGGFGPQILLNIAAELEPDADKDGYGDETQDLCPTQTATQGACAAISFGKPKVDVKKGTAKVIVQVSGAGLVKLTGKSIAAQTKQSKQAGEITLLLRPKGAAKKKLAKKGKLKVVAEVAFTPTSGGDSIVRTVKAKLRKKP